MTAPVALVQSSTGLLFADDFNRPTIGGIGSNWSVVNGSWGIAANTQLQEASSTTPLLTILCNGVSSRQDVYVQCLMAGSGFVGFPGIVARYSGGLSYTLLASGSNDGGVTWETGLFDETFGGYLGTHSTDGSPSSTQNRFNYSVSGTTLTGWKNGTQRATYGLATQRSGQVGLQVYALAGAHTGTFDDFIACTTSTLTGTSLPSGYKIRAGGVSSGAGNGVDPVTADVAGLSLPLSAVELLDGGGSVAYTLTQSVYGGDSYRAVTLTAATPTVTLPVMSTLTVSWTASEWVSSVTYRGEISVDGGSSWSALFSGVSGLTSNTSAAGYAHARNAIVRIRAEASEGNSDWAQSAPFVIFRRVLRMEYERGKIRSDRGELVDKGNFGINPEHPDFAGGAKGDGLSDDYLALFAANAFAVSLGAPLLLPPDRVFRCNTNLSITAFVEGLGGQIRPASGVTVTLSGGYRNVLEAIGETSLGGTVTLSRPSSPVLGQVHPDVSSNKLIWWNGSVWKDGAGSTVA